MKTYTVQEVAKWFLSHESMTHKKLQKLCYYAQAWYCALYDGTPLYDAEIQAWVHGPVVASLYSTYADYKWSEIPKYDGENVSFNVDATSVLVAVYETYGGFTGDQLESLTHSEEPWINARGGLRPLEPCTNVISCSSMRTYYQRKYEEGQND